MFSVTRKGKKEPGIHVVKQCMHVPGIREYEWKSSTVTDKWQHVGKWGRGIEGRLTRENECKRVSIQCMYTVTTPMLLFLWHMNSRNLLVSLILSLRIAASFAYMFYMLSLLMWTINVPGVLGIFTLINLSQWILSQLHANCSNSRDISRFSMKCNENPTSARLCYT